MMAGALVGLGVSLGAVLVFGSLWTHRRPSLEDRMAPYLRDIDSVGLARRRPPVSLVPVSVWWAVFGPSVIALAQAVERLLGGSASVRRRLRRLGSDGSVEAFRMQQVLWGGWAFGGVAAVALVWSLRSPPAPVPSLIACVVAFVVGVFAKDNSLSRAVGVRERQMIEEFPTMSDLMALAVAAGEGPVSALERTVGTSHGELSDELRQVLAQIRTGTPIATAFDDLASRTGLPSIARFAEGLAIAVERGTPLVAVLHAQAADAREVSRRALIEAAARKEITMMLPVVFLIMPTTIVFAFFPGVIGLHLTSP